MLVHICCSVDSFYFLAKLKEEFPDEPLIGFFDNPNIHPYSEYYLRKIDAQRSCDHFGIPMIEGDYDVQGWLEMVKGFEDEPEKGSRCILCFDDRLEATCLKAIELGEERYTTTLLMSPQKDHAQLRTVGKFLYQRHGKDFIAPDYRKGGGTQAQQVMSKERRAYHQDYCGCLFALEDQRQMQGRMMLEMISPLSQQIQPNSIEERLALYERRWELEKQGLSYTIKRERFLNWRLLRSRTMVNGVVVPSHVLPYSTVRRSTLKGVVTARDENLYLLNREEVTLVTLDTYNDLMQTTYSTLDALVANPPSFEAECRVRGALGKGVWDVSALLVVQTLAVGDRCEILLESTLFEDTRERLVSHFS